MAGEFWKGLGHGGLLSAAVLAVLAIGLPVSERDQRQEDSTQSAAGDEAAKANTPSAAAEGAGPAPSRAASDSAGPESARPQPQQPQADRAQPDRPEAAALDLPVGSEFARGGDIAPVLPAPLSDSSRQLRQSEAPAVTAPAAEPAPVAVISDAIRPETADPGQTGPDAPDPVEAPDLQQPAALDLPGRAALPGFDAVMNLPDNLPDTTAPDLPVADAADVSEEAPIPDHAETPPAEVAEISQGAGMAESVETAADPHPASSAVTPAARTSGPDLSLPPDLSLLRRARQ